MRLAGGAVLDQVERNAAFGGDGAVDQLAFAHLQADDQSGLLLAHHGVQHEAHGQGGFAHGRAPRHDDQLLGLQAAQLLVQIGQTGRQADQRFAA
ncbi:hypothetical protein D3C80_1435660 [compost metagenome]